VLDKAKNIGLPVLKPGIDRAHALRALSKHFHKGKHLPSLPPDAYPNGFTVQNCIEVWVVKGEDGLLALEELNYVTVMTLGMFFYFFLTSLLFSLLFIFL